jgi:hypothetical protein
MILARSIAYPFCHCRSMHVYRRANLRIVLSVTCRFDLTPEPSVRQHEHNNRLLNYRSQAPTKSKRQDRPPCLKVCWSGTPCGVFASSTMRPRQKGHVALDSPPPFETPPPLACFTALRPRTIQNPAPSSGTCSRVVRRKGTSYGWCRRRSGRYGQRLAHDLVSVEAGKRAGQMWRWRVRVQVVRIDFDLGSEWGCPGYCLMRMAGNGAAWTVHGGAAV